MQDIASRQWSKQGTVISVRTAQDGMVVFYLLNINGFETARHRKYMRKLNIPDDTEIERAMPRETGLGPERAGRQPTSQAEPQLRRSTRLRDGAQNGL